MEDLQGAESQLPQLFVNYGASSGSFGPKTDGESHLMQKLIMLEDYSQDTDEQPVENPLDLSHHFLQVDISDNFNEQRI